MRIAASPLVAARTSVNRPSEASVQVFIARSTSTAAPAGARLASTIQTGTRAPAGQCGAAVSCPMSRSAAVTRAL